MGVEDRERKRRKKKQCNNYFIDYLILFFVSYRKNKVSSPTSKLEKTNHFQKMRKGK